MRAPPRTSSPCRRACPRRAGASRSTRRTSPALRVLERVVGRALREPEPLRADLRPRAVEDRASRAGSRRPPRRACSRQGRGSRRISSSPVVEPLIPIFGSIRPTSNPGVSASTTKARDAVVAAGRIGLREDDVQMGDAGVRDEALRAVEDVVVAVAPRLAPHRGAVGARARLGERVRGEPLARRELRQEPLLLLVGAAPA